MRYALRKQAKIASVYSEDYLNKHIIKSLDSYFGNTSDEHITDDISQEGYVTSTGEDYPILKVNDLSDDNAIGVCRYRFGMRYIKIVFFRTNKRINTMEIDRINLV